MRLTLWVGLVCFFLTTIVFASPPQVVRKVLARLKYSVPLYKAGIGFSILTEECLTFRTVSPPPLLIFHPHLPLGRLLICSHICFFSDDFCFAPFIRRNFVPSGLLHSFSTNLRVPPIFVFQQSTLTFLSLLFLIISFILSCFSYQ